MGNPKKAQLTQKLVNAFPLWTDIRTDDQSLGFQILNYISGTHLDHLYKQVIRGGNNYYLNSSVISDPDLYYAVRLPASYEFTKSDDDETELIYDAPTVSGYIDDTNYEVVIASGNNMNGFWFDPAPSRFELGTTYSGAYLLTSGYISQSPFDPMLAEGLLFFPNQLSVTMSGGTTYIAINEGVVERGVVQIDGTTRAGVYLTEEMPFIHDDTQKTFNEFYSVSGIRVYGVDDPDEAFLWVNTSDYNNNHRKVAYQLDNSVDGDSIPYFWTLFTSDTLSLSMLGLEKYDLDPVDVRMAGFVDRHSVVDIELLDEHSQSIYALDLATEPHSNRIWVISSDTLYCYEADIPYPDLSSLTEKTYGAACRIEVDNYYVGRGEDVVVNYVWRRPAIGLLRHRVWVEYPDGNKYSIIDGSVTTYTTGEDSWNYGEPYSRVLRASDTITLSQRGSYIFSIEATYIDDTTSIDQRIVMVPYKVPLKEYSLSSLGIYRPAAGIDIDSENKIWIRNDQTGQHELVPHWDIMLIDYSGKVIYLREDYDRVRVF